MKSKALLHKSAAEHNLTHILKRASSPPRNNSKRGGNSGRGRFQKPIDKPKTRKELRKEMRKNKKSMKHTYILSKFGKTPESLEPLANKKKRKRKNRKRNRNNDNNKTKDMTEDDDNLLDDDDTNSSPGKYVKVLQQSKKIAGNKKAGTSSRAASDRLEDDKELEQLKKDMEETRKRRLLDENAEEDKFISQMEKRLRLNKKAKIPESFRTDGLDYLLELCQSSGKKKTKEEDVHQKLDKKMNSVDDDDDDSDELLDEEEDPESMDDDDEESDSGNEAEGDEDSEDALSDVVEEESDEDEDTSDKDIELDNVEENSDDHDSDASSDVKMPKSKKKKKKKTKDKKVDDGLWEDIYGRMRRKDGSVVDEKSNITEELKSSKTDVAIDDHLPIAAPILPSGKYVPPNQRKSQSPRDRISRSLKGLLNRLSEANMNSISKQIEELYMENSRNEINECMLELLYAALVRNVSIPDRVILENVMLIAILHANVGTEIGAFFLQKFVEDFRKKYDFKGGSSDDNNNKELENLLLLISYMYHFKIVDAGLLYDILKLLATNFEPIDVELILACLRSIGFRLRKDDPIELKSLIILIQQKANASKSGASGAKVKFMLEVVTAIRNNNMTKIPNYDPSVGDHLAKILKSHIHKGNYVSTMKIKMEDLLNAETKGRWWIVGSAWSNMNERDANKSNADSAPTLTKDKEHNEKLLAKARALGMNTETRKTVFFILMTAEDYIDAFNKLNHLDLKNNQEREVIYVTTYCCIHEKKFNPYYGLIASKFCALDRKHMYPDWFKQEVAEYSKIYGQRAVSRMMAISQRRIFEWLQPPKSDDDATPRPSTSSLSSRSRKQLMDFDIEKDLHAWVLDQLPVKVSSTVIRAKAKEMYRAKGHTSMECSYGWFRRWSSRFNLSNDPHQDTDNLILSWMLHRYDQNCPVSVAEIQQFAQQNLSGIKPGFCASSGWATRFLKRHYLLLNWDDLYLGQLPPEMENHYSEFLRRVQNSSILKYSSTDVIGSMDEIPICFSDLSSDQFQLQASPRVKKYSIMKCDAAVILTVMGNGDFLSPLVILKDEHQAQLYRVYSQDQSSIVVYYSDENTAPKITCLEKWYELIWSRNISGGQQALLFMDDYKLHHEFKAKFDGSLILHVELFPAGTGCKLQPLNASIRRQFLSYMEEYWQGHLKRDSPIDEQTKILHPSTDEIIQWVSGSYEKLKKQQGEILRQAFPTTKLVAAAVL